jgi:hypothetical protein
MPDSPDFGNDLHQHPDLHLAPQLQNLSDHFFHGTTHQFLKKITEFSPVAKCSRIMLLSSGYMPYSIFATGYLFILSRN